MKTERISSEWPRRIQGVLPEKTAAIWANLHRVLGFRFVYGAHTISPIVVGMSGIKPGYFTIMNAAGSVLWTLVMFLIGYFFSHAYGMFIDDVKRYEKPIALVLAAMVIIYYMARRLIWRKVSAEKL